MQFVIFNAVPKFFFTEKFTFHRYLIGELYNAFNVDSVEQLIVNRPTPISKPN